MSSIKFYLPGQGPARDELNRDVPAQGEQGNNDTNQDDNINRDNSINQDNTEPLNPQITGLFHAVLTRLDYHLDRASTIEEQWRKEICFENAQVLLNHMNQEFIFLRNHLDRRHWDVGRRIRGEPSKFTLWGLDATQGNSGAERQFQAKIEDEELGVKVEFEVKVKIEPGTESLKRKASGSDGRGGEEAASRKKVKEEMREDVVVKVEGGVSVEGDGDEDGGVRVKVESDD